MGVLRELSLCSWEVLFGYLEPRHLARLAQTGDERVSYAIEYAWRTCDVRDFPDLVPNGKTDSDLVKRTLVGKSRSLLIRAGNLVHSGRHFPLLDSVYIDETEIKSTVYDQWRRYLVECHDMLDFTTLAPNLRTIKMHSNLSFNVVFPPLLETLELDVIHSERPFSKMASVESLHSLTRLQVRGGFTNGVLSSDLVLPESITSLYISLYETDLAFMDKLPPYVTDLHISNCAGKLSTTLLCHLPLIKLEVTNSWDGPTTGASCIVLGALPPSLTSMQVESLGVIGKGCKVIDALRTLPSSLSRLSFETLFPHPSVGEMTEIMDLLSPRIDMRAMVPITIFLRNRYGLGDRSADDDCQLERLVSSMLKERGSGPDFLEMINLIALSYFERTDLYDNPIVPLIEKGVRKEYIEHIVASDPHHYGRVTMVPTTSREYQFVLTALRNAFVSTMKIGAYGCKQISAYSACNVEKMEIWSYANSRFTDVFKSKLDRLNDLFICEGYNHGCSD